MNKPPSNAAPEWMRTAGATSVVVGILGFIASAAVGGGGTLEGAILAGMLNPLFFVGVPLGFYWLNRGGAFAPSPETYGRTPIRKPPPPAPIQPKPVPISKTPVPARPTPSGNGCIIIAVAAVAGFGGAILGSYLTFMELDSRSRSSVPGDSSASMATVDEPSDDNDTLYWTIGSSKETVEEIEGTPVRIRKSQVVESWSYNWGDSVTFDIQTGKVFGWYNESGRLRAAMVTNGKIARPDPKATFQEGSTKEDVVRAQGSPKRVEKNTMLRQETWTYNRGDTVTFDSQNDRVLSWGNYSKTLRGVGGF